MTIDDIYARLDALASDTHKVACSLDVGPERTQAFALYTVLHRLQRRSAAAEIHDLTNPLIEHVPRSAVNLPPSHLIDVRGDGPIRLWSTVAVYRADEVKAMLRAANIEIL